MRRQGLKPNLPAGQALAQRPQGGALGVVQLGHAASRSQQEAEPGAAGAPGRQSQGHQIAAVQPENGRAQHPRQRQVMQGRDEDIHQGHQILDLAVLKQGNFFADIGRHAMRRQRLLLQIRVHQLLRLHRHRLHHLMYLCRLHFLDQQPRHPRH